MPHNDTTLCHQFSLLYFQSYCSLMTILVFTLTYFFIEIVPPRFSQIVGNYVTNELLQVSSEGTLQTVIVRKVTQNLPCSPLRVLMSAQTSVRLDGSWKNGFYNTAKWVGSSHKTQKRFSTTFSNKRIREGFIGFRVVCRCRLFPASLTNTLRKHYLLSANDTTMDRLELATILTNLANSNVVNPASGGVTTADDWFLRELRKILHCDRTAHIVSWLPEGKIWRIHDLVSFQTTILSNFPVMKDYGSPFDLFLAYTRVKGFQEISRGANSVAFYHHVSKQIVFHLVCSIALLAFPLSHTIMTCAL